MQHQRMPLESVVTSGVVQLPVDLNNHTIKNVLMMKINDHESQFYSQFRAIKLQITAPINLKLRHPPPRPLGKHRPFGHHLCLEGGEFELELCQL